jgi:hypothetical protein
MIKINRFLILSIILTSCYCSKHTISKSANINKSDYVNAFKAYVFSGCFNESTNEKFNKFLIANNDLGLFSENEIIFHSVSNFADSIGREFSRNIKPFDYGDGQGLMPNYSGCYLFSLSEKIDSLAIIKYNNYLDDNH